MLAPGTLCFQREHYFRRFEGLIEVLLELLERVMRVFLDNEAAQLSQLGLKEGINDDLITVDCRFVHLDQVLESGVYTLFKSLHLVFVHYLGLVKLQTRLHSRDFML